ncbi:hypothetical protein [Streptomyces griseus]|uniref:hypothetical protein n=1 Tax=Streptomyces griseus TaxID=1911 RepID=UPI0036AEDD28
MLDRQKLIAAGARPVLYLSREEMQQTRQLPTSLRNRRVRYDPGFSDWLHEREWRLCFEPEQTPELAITPQLVVGVIVGRQGWMPPPRHAKSADVVSDLKDQLRSVPALLESLREQMPGGSIRSLRVSVGSTRTKFAGAADRLARWYWDGGDLVPDGVFDIRDQQMRDDSLHHDQGPMFEVGWSTDVTE